MGLAIPNEIYCDRLMSNVKKMINLSLFDKLTQMVH